MKATGIVRRIDELGRIVIPKEIRKKLRIKERDGIEVFLNADGEIVLKKFSEYNDLGKYYKIICNTLYEMSRNTVLITSMDEVSFVASNNPSCYEGKFIEDKLLELIEKRKVLNQRIKFFDLERSVNISLYPLINQGDLLGALIMVHDCLDNKKVNHDILKYNEKLLLKYFE